MKGELKAGDGILSPEVCQKKKKNTEKKKRKGRKKEREEGEENLTVYGLSDG